MGQARYGRDTHKQAFEIFYETRTYWKVAETIGCNYTTSTDWARKDYRCRFGCPWHGWDDLIQERDAVMQARLDLLKKGDANPLHHAEAMKSAIKNPNREISHTVKLLVRTDLERLAHLELLYGKVFHDITGIPLAFDELRDPDGASIDVRDVYLKGLRFTTAGEAIRTLSTIIDKIHALEATMRVSGVLDAESSKPKEGSSVTVSIADLREVRRMLVSTPSKVITGLLDCVKEEKVLDASSTEREVVGDSVGRGGREDS